MPGLSALWNRGNRWDRLGMQHHRRAFTLIELLVVISIVSLLVSILLPSLATARAAAQRTQCAGGHLRQIGLAAFIYANNFSDTMPMGGLNEAGGFYRAGGFLRANVSGHQYPHNLWTCPANTRTHAGVDFHRYSTEPPAAYAPGFAWNARTGSPEKGHSGSKPSRRFSELHFAHNNIMAGDAEGYIHTNRYYYKSDVIGQGYRVHGQFRDFQRHRNMVNFLFTDGHIQAWQPDQLTHWLDSYSAGKGADFK